MARIAAGSTFAQIVIVATIAAIPHFMGSRYLADDLERAKTLDCSVGSESGE